MKISILIFGTILYLCQTVWASPLKVLATTSIIADTVQHIGGKEIELNFLMGPGIDPHSYKATAGDLKKMLQAEIILFHGLFLESKLSEIFSKLKTKAYPVAETVPQEKLVYPTKNKQYPDPHIWFDVHLWEYAVQEITRILILKRPQKSKIFEDARDKYILKMKKLDAYVFKQAKNIPKAYRILVTAHDAFHYFGERYGIQYKALQGINTTTEAGILDIQKLADFVASKKLPAIFVESTISPKTIKALQQAIISRGHQVSIGGELYSDALGTLGTESGTYLGMVKYNIDVISSALKSQDKNEK